MRDESLKKILRLLLPEKLRAGCREQVYALANRRSLRRAALPENLTEGVALWGLAGESSGIGQCCRSMARALGASSLPFSLHPLHSRSGGELDLSAFRDALSETRDMSVNLYCFNADCTGTFLRQAGPAAMKGRKNIALWAWELPRFPESFSPAFQWYDEIWTISEFCRAAIQERTEKSVRVLPLCVEPESDRSLSRADFSLPEGRLLFLSMYDARSIQARKNPRSVIEAYCAAFPREGDTGLVLKISGGEQGQREAEELRRSLRRRDIYFLEGVWSEKALYRLFELCDVFVSLHRSEGFGYPIAEAMALGKAVLVTGYSGNMDFCSSENACLVGYTLHPLGDAAVAPYTPEQLWAEPALNEAAAAMVRLREDEPYRRALGAAARSTIREKYSASACAEAIEAALRGG